MINKKINLILLPFILFLTSCNNNTSKKYSLTLSFDSLKGNVLGASVGEYISGTNIYFKAIPNEGYKLENFIVNEEVFKGSDSIQFTLTQDTFVSVNFIDENMNNDPLLPPIHGDRKEEVVGSIKPIVNTKYQLKSINEYYEGVNLNLKGESLKIELKKVTTLKTVYNYGDSRFTLQYIDEDIDNKGKLLSIYDAKKFDPIWEEGKTWNREHVWAQSHLFDADANNNTKGPESDLHNLRACTNSTNSSRGNDYFSNNDSGQYYFPNKAQGYDFRGDVARICFYMYTNYDGLKLSDNPGSDSSVSMGVLSHMIKRNKEDPVDIFERQRNMKIYQYQGNRNPFIDFPKLADSLFLQ